MARLFPWLVALFACAGCAREPMEPAVAPPYDWPGHRHWAPGTPQQRTAAATRPARSRQGARSERIPHGEACLSWLAQHRIAHRMLGPKPGMQTPIAVVGPIGGVRYYTVDGSSLVCDCRLAVALHWVSPHLRDLGVTEVRHSGAYVYRTTRKGRLSLHALGLAIDVHEVTFGSRRLSVEDDYHLGRATACAPGSPHINRLACRLDGLAIFKELITPDDDRDHHDHLHLAIAPL